MCRERGKRTKAVLIIERMNRERKRNKKLWITGKYDWWDSSKDKDKDKNKTENKRGKIMKKK